MESFKEVGLYSALDTKRSRGDSMIRYLNTFYLEGEKNGMQVKFWLVVKQ